MNWIIFLLCAAVFFVSYLSISVHREKQKEQKKMQRYSDALHKIAMNAKEEDIQIMATKVLLDDNYDPRWGDVQ